MLLAKRGEFVGRSEQDACRAFKNLLKEKWSLVVLRGGCSKALKLVVDSARPFVFLGDGAPMPSFCAPTCIARVGTNGGKALPDFRAACVARGGRGGDEGWREHAADMSQTKAQERQK